MCSLWAVWVLDLYGSAAIDPHCFAGISARLQMCFTCFRRSIAPHVLRWRVRWLIQRNAPDHPAIRVAARAFGDVFGTPTVFVRSGGSIPIVGDFATHLGIPTILMGFGLPDDGLHSPNEKDKIENYYLGIRTVAHFLEQYGRE